MAAARSRCLRLSVPSHPAPAACLPARLPSPTLAYLPHAPHLYSIKADTLGRLMHREGALDNKGMVSSKSFAVRIAPLLPTVLCRLQNAA